MSCAADMAKAAPRLRVTAQSRENPILWKTAEGGLNPDILRSRHPRKIKAGRFCHPKGRSEAEDGAAVDGFPRLDTLSRRTEDLSISS